MDDVHRYDILVCDSQIADQSRWKASFLKQLSSRVIVHTTVGSAIDSCKAASFNAIVCGLQLAETDCWRFIAMIRSGRFCFSEIPIFVICPPEKKAALEPMLDPHTTLLGSSSKKVIAAQVAAHLTGHVPPSVLVVEDEPAAAQAAFQGLRKYYSVELAYDGPSGLLAWQERRHPVVILDLMLPGMTGSEVQKLIMQTEPKQRIIILTAHDGLDIHQDHIMAGACEFLPKPMNIHLLSSVIARVLRERHILDQAERTAAFDAVAARVQAAEVTLNRGSTAEAAHHLSHARFTCRAAQSPSDDQWLQLMTEPLHRKSGD